MRYVETLEECVKYHRYRYNDAEATDARMLELLDEGFKAARSFKEYFRLLEFSGRCREPIHKKIRSRVNRLLDGRLKRAKSVDVCIDLGRMRYSFKERAYSRALELAMSFEDCMKISKAFDLKGASMQKALSFTTERQKIREIYDRACDTAKVDALAKLEEVCSILLQNADGIEEFQRIRNTLPKESELRKTSAETLAEMYKDAIRASESTQECIRLHKHAPKGYSVNMVAFERTGELLVLEAKATAAIAS